MSDISHIVDTRFMSEVMTCLSNHPQGIKEYHLLKQLDEAGYFKALSNKASYTLMLFQKHFLLFHALYTINLSLIIRKEGAILISPLNIMKIDHKEAKKQIGELDSLSEFYLDINNFENANEDNVNDLLDIFWEKYLRNEKRSDALKVLGLNDPVEDKDIIKRYKKLANKHHPDKGGDLESIQDINLAYAVLIKSRL